jgi:hypothetical protein
MEFKELFKSFLDGIKSILVSVIIIWISSYFLNRTPIKVEKRVFKDPPKISISIKSQTSNFKRYGSLVKTNFPIDSAKIDSSHLLLSKRLIFNLLDSNSIKFEFKTENVFFNNEEIILDIYAKRNRDNLMLQLIPICDNKDLNIIHIAYNDRDEKSGDPKYSFSIFILFGFALSIILFQFLLLLKKYKKRKRILKIIKKWSCCNETYIYFIISGMIKEFGPIKKIYNRLFDIYIEKPDMISLIAKEILNLKNSSKQITNYQFYEAVYIEVRNDIKGYYLGKGSKMNRISNASVKKLFSDYATIIIKDHARKY